MLDSSRLMLCMFVMSVMFFNPFNLILSLKDSTINGPATASAKEYTAYKSMNSRVLNSVDLLDTNTPYEDNMSQNSFILSKYADQSVFNASFLASWSLNLLLILFCLVRIYVNGEPYMEFDSHHDNYIWLHYQKVNLHYLDVPMYIIRFIKIFINERSYEVKVKDIC